MDAIEVDERTRKQLLKLVATIYKDHWRNTWEVQKPAMREATADLEKQIDLQPVLEAIVRQAVPMRAHTRICTEAFDAEYAAKCDENSTCWRSSQTSTLPYALARAPRRVSACATVR